ncbi:MAG: hypothetical protein WCP08_11410 [Prolixibacteraceae bacterium]
MRRLSLSEIGILFLLLFGSPSLIDGQSIKEFKEISVNESREYLLNNQKPLPYLQSGFHYFSREQDNALAEGLESEWVKFPVIPGRSVPKSKRFDSAPLFNYEETSSHNPRYLPCFTAEKNESFDETLSANLPRIRKPEYTSASPSRLSFKFFGNTIAISFDKLLALPVNQPVSKEIAIEYWRKFQVANSNHLVAQLMTYRDRLGLNEWGYFLLVKACSGALYPADESGSTLLSWSLMIRSGFDVKLGVNQLGSSLLYTTTPKISGVPSVKIDGAEYYIDKSISSFPVSSYTPKHPGASGSIHLNINQSINFQGESEIKKIQFPWDKKLFEFNLKFNPEVVHYLEAYPQTDPVIFANAPFSFQAKESLFRQLRPVLSGMKKEEAAAFLQQFVQKSFAYRPYNDLFGYDRFMFPEELLFSDESNDKGKALLYAWLINNLLVEKAVLVEFPGFFSVAISLGRPMDGDNFLIDGTSYTMADPTFENAPIGLVMKEFYQLKPLILPLKNPSEAISQQDKIWKLAMTIGAERSGTGRDFLRDENGASYITGYFREKNSKGISTSPAPFVARFDEFNKLTWMVKFHSSGRAFGLELHQLDRNEFYLAGSFRGDLGCNGLKITSNSSDPDLFFAQLNSQGELGWMSKSGLDDLEEDTKLFYVVRFTRSGEIQTVQLANEDERTGTTGFRQSTNEGMCYVASRYQTIGLDKPSEEPTLKPTLLFRQNLNRMRQLGIDMTTATLTSLLKSLINPGSQLSGSDLASFRQEKLLSGNNSNSSLTQLIQKIKLLRNNNGIIEIQTTDSMPIPILSFKISRESHLMIIPLDNNDLKIKVIDGIVFESGLSTEKVNSMIIDLSSSNLILDIGTDHQLISKNLKHEILK